MAYLLITDHTSVGEGIKQQKFSDSTVGSGDWYVTLESCWTLSIKNKHMHPL